MRPLITGGSGFFGTHLKHYLADEGHGYVNLDLIPDHEDVERSRMFPCDLTEEARVDLCFRKHGPFDAVIHVAAQLAHDVNNPEYLWESNVTGTRHLAEAAAGHRVKSLIFTSSNCLWGRPLNRPVVEDDAHCPVEIYGRSKLEAERVLLENRDRLQRERSKLPAHKRRASMGLIDLLRWFS